MTKQHQIFSVPYRDGTRSVRIGWPALKGSLAKIFKPCVRPNCPACARGDKHPAWILSTSQQGRRRCLYVPVDLVPSIQQAIRNGRKIEQLLADMGPALVQAHRNQRVKKERPANSRAKS